MNKQGIVLGIAFMLLLIGIALATSTAISATSDGLYTPSIKTRLEVMKAMNESPFTTHQMKAWT